MLTYIYLIAITAEAMSGALMAGRRNMDIVGVSVIAFVTALGGGTVRDLLGIDHNINLIAAFCIGISPLLISVR